MPNFTLVIGTNEVGKSTFGEKLTLQTKGKFIDVDAIYKLKFKDKTQFSKEELIEASKDIEKYRRGLFSLRKNVVQELIVTKKSQAERLMATAKEHGYTTNLYYIGIDSDNALEYSQDRINKRFAKGLHYVEPEIVKSNLEAVNKNFKEILELFDNIVIYDNTMKMSYPRRVLDVREGIVHHKSDEMPNFVNKLIKDTFLEDLLQH
ncbi:hypothetical protein B6S12_01655 [Helicobacter valdiviensis]|uniref:Zeta toxin domain-containing protein n=1 Tax=Helicobacter valdiviensis TaxID=1458358 RepID=A0A2W6MW97_9HELI|nr:zeta toxin family protein [Helicobacter valdiviensis]PZT48784.1 hypothetical protein B6S12_01655 [Helicobacter valdiviensis]